MKNFNFAIFFSIVLAIYAAVNFYIFIRGWQAIPRGMPLRVYYLIFFLFVSLSFIIGRVLEKYYLSLISDIFVWIGSFWLGAMLYFFLIIVALDLARLVNHWWGIFPSAVMSDYARAKLTTLVIAIGAVAVILVVGHINTLYPRIKKLDLEIDKSAPKHGTVNIAAVSDIHLGTIIARKRADQLVEKINGLSPDLVILIGDIVDEDLAPVIRENLGEALRNIKAKLGIYAITGNHECYGGLEAACKYMEDHNIKVLRDSAVLIEGGFYLVGRYDREVGRIYGRQRKALDSLMSGLDRSLPVILLDHQPLNLGEAAANGIDIQLSGHTHHGQLWPFNYITKLVYELSTGYMKKGNTHYYVSTGYGTWGPPVRTDSRPEIVQIRMRY